MSGLTPGYVPAFVAADAEKDACFESRRSGRDFEIGVGLAPEKWNTRHKILRVDELSRARKFVGPEKPHASGKFRSGDLSADGRRRNAHFGIVAQPLGFSRL